MSKIITPKDCRGNDLFVGCECTLIQRIPFIFRVVVVENGGLQTPQGVTPAHVRLLCDMSLRQLPGVPFDSIIRTVAPTEQAVVEAIASKLARG